MKSFIVFALCLTVVRLAQATEFVCFAQHQYPGSPLTLMTSPSQIQVKAADDLKDLVGIKSLKFDSKYAPRAQHEGAHRYLGSNTCGEYAFILDKNMVAGQSGYATLQQDCDSDGSGPSYVNFACKVQ